MQQDSTDKILQRMESQQLPDLSQMDKHWEDMRLTLIATAIVKPTMSAMAKWMIAATLVGAIALFGWKKGWFSSGNNNKTILQQELVKVKPQPALLKQDSVFSPNIVIPNFQLNFSSIKIPPFVFATPPIIGYSDSGNNKTAAATYTLDRSQKDIPSEKQTEAMNAQLMQQFWNQVEKKPQQFVIDNRYDSQIDGAEGTSIKIPANAFAFAGDGKVTIELTEFYEYGEMIANKLTTSSYQRQLVSDGMLRIRAMQKGEEIKMTGLKPMDVYMPRRDKSEDMQLFAGEWKNFIGNPKLINWIPMGQQQNRRFRDGSGNGVLEPYVVRKRLFSKKHVLKYGLNKWDTLTVATMKPLLQDAFSNDIVKVRKGQPRYIGLFRKTTRNIGRYEDYGYQLPFTTRGINQYGYGVRYTGEAGKADSLQRRYNFSVTSTGWINCDRFMEDPSPKIEFAVAGNKDEKIYCSYLVFKDIKSVLPGYTYNNRSTFQDIAEGKDVTLITIGIRNGKTVCSMRDMKTGRGDITGLHFDETNPEKFKQTLLAMRL